MQEREYWLGFSVFSGIGPKRFSLLLSHFQSAKKVWEADTGSLKPFLKEVLTSKFDAFRNSFALNGFAKDLKAKEISFLTLQDKDYPRLLAQSQNPPFVLYVKGQKSLLSASDKKYIGIVGTRKITSYGCQVTELIAKQAVQKGVVVSGLALGVDAVAHNQALLADGETIAVLGSGVDLCYPIANLRLYQKILGGKGVIVSEYPPGTKPSVGSFPSRNRIIAGLCHILIVTEGAEDSGSLITARFAFANKRPVLAVPGPITSGLSKGPNLLIQKGAKILTDIENLGFYLGEEKNKKMSKKIVSENKNEQKILDFLTQETKHFDELVRLTGFKPSDLGMILSLLEIKGFAQNMGGGFYSLAYP